MGGRRAARWAGDDAKLCVSAVAWGEYLCGPLDPDELQAVRALVEPALALTDVDAELAAHLFNLGGRRKRSLSDCFIAATAIRAGAPLATSNRQDFARFIPAGLQLA